jgi:hypothetical protein
MKKYFYSVFSYRLNHSSNAKKLQKIEATAAKTAK